MSYRIKSNSSSVDNTHKLTATLVSKAGISVSLLGALVLTLSGCATTQSLTPQQCQSSNWQDVGYADGLQGRSGAYFGNYTNSCASVGGANPNRIQWEQGRQQGLKNYCTELNAYKLGREGYDWQPVCPLEGIEKLEEAYSQGRYYYIRQRDLDYLRAPYPFGYGHLGFGYRPFGYGW
ncbi:MAG: DUF2799 domain-containing protein [Psychrobacter sp.]|uniref:DUF2799 domain-containing protein n=1 Tax=Psychrobacter sp. TaxID=56811 RepID=UPI0026498653|nr:DUF2799 domain-containing protein [Psychrobacter sp.]MDN5620929.1 DUF2799 domain-containing protein [Psychrobacter sp.]